jgi:hypothetical protein
MTTADGGVTHEAPHRNATDRENYINSLRKAGLPE